MTTKTMMTPAAGPKIETALPGPNWRIIEALRISQSISPTAPQSCCDQSNRRSHIQLYVSSNDNEWGWTHRGSAANR
jgi:hypothetical protein